ncbi:4Fe-4S dicluster domain-containing protein [Marinobacterium sediminicola]|uniref:4Fe-4S dicluster domain-containing protein n=1 Tax=Marinobacterium sediminicola TaxID=518898 RepID=A0ABY1S4J2_9GAMM|nr:4Fe-4S dicluster domain-containing protein [Marinobacterium sediminicola]ULG70120.1 4Fe-4S dicluster domain-containing protein [Marinobacterium sediminicola]SMR78395.1 4Fe-4S dicluster domain-containing protein [Marinobacterium sediminicola]
MSAADFLPRSSLSSLIDLLQQQGYRVVGPQVIDGAILYRPLQQADQLPAGIEQIQQPGQYRLIRTQGPRLFSWANGPQALKPLTFAPRETLWRSHLQADGSLRFEEVIETTEPTAVLGVRGCDLAALSLQDQHFSGDPYYQQRRDSLLLIAVDCSHPADTCFCASTGDGPDARAGYDLALVELDDGYRIRAGSPKGQSLMDNLPLDAATPEQQQQTDEQHQKACQQQRHLPAFEPSRLIHQGQHPIWDSLAEACLSCGNCTSVCPSCFCFSESEVPELDGTTSGHQRQWDSCFSEGHSYIHGHRFRPDTKSRYRQWLTHKFGSWVEQYGRSGCTGCGRCISWCPVGIDPLEALTELGREDVE